MKFLSEDNMQSLIQVIADDLVSAKLYSDYVKDIKLQLDQYPQVLAAANTFWQNTMRAYQLAMQLHIQRVYDQLDNTISLKVLLKSIKDNIALFSLSVFRERMANDIQLNSLINQRKTDEDFNTWLDQAINDIDSKKNKLVKSLVTIRHTNSFHRSLALLLKEKTNIDHIEISYKELDVLIDKGLDILNVVRVNLMRV